MNFGSVLTAMVTPFNKSGDIDFDQTTKVVEHLLANGTEGLVVAGTTGESPTLSSQEKLDLFKHVVKVTNGRAPVIAGTGNNNTKASIELTKAAEACGVDAIMLVTPYYNKPDQRGLYAHFKAISEATKLPVMLYNIPSRSTVNMTAETTIALSKVANIVSVKEASGDFNQVSEIIENTGDDFSVYCGDDGMTLPMMAIGAQGIVSVAAHVIGSEINQMVKTFEAGDYKAAAAMHRALVPTMAVMFIAPSPSPVKYALKLKGIETGGVRLPLVELIEAEENLIKAVVTQ